MEYIPGATHGQAVRIFSHNSELMSHTSIRTRRASNPAKARLFMEEKYSIDITTFMHVRCNNS